MGSISLFTKRKYVNDCEELKVMMVKTLGLQKSVFPSILPLIPRRNGLRPSTHMRMFKTSTSKSPVQESICPKTFIPLHLTSGA